MEFTIPATTKELRNLVKSPFLWSLLDTTQNELAKLTDGDGIRGSAEKKIEEAINQYSQVIDGIKTEQQAISAVVELILSLNKMIYPALEYWIYHHKELSTAMEDFDGSDEEEKVLQYYMAKVIAIKNEVASSETEQQRIPQSAQMSRLDWFEALEENGMDGLPSAPPPKTCNKQYKELSDSLGVEMRELRAVLKVCIKSDLGLLGSLEGLITGALYNRKDAKRMLTLVLCEPGTAIKDETLPFIDGINTLIEKCEGEDGASLIKKELFNFLNSFAGPDCAEVLKSVINFEEYNADEVWCIVNSNLDSAISPYVFQVILNAVSEINTICFSDDEKSILRKVYQYCLTRYTTNCAELAQLNDAASAERSEPTLLLSVNSQSFINTISFINTMQHIDASPGEGHEFEPGSRAGMR